MWFQYIYRHVRRCLHALVRFGTSHDVNACVDSVHECYLDIFLLQVSNSTCCHSRSIVNVIKKIQTKYIIEVLFERNSVYSRCPLIIFNLTAQKINWLEGFMYKRGNTYLSCRLRHSAEMRQCRICFGN